MTNQEKYFIFYCTSHNEYHFIVKGEDTSLFSNCRKTPNSGYYWNCPKEIAEKILKELYIIEGAIVCLDDPEESDECHYKATLHYNPGKKCIWVSVRFNAGAPNMGPIYVPKNNYTIKKEFKTEVPPSIWDITYIDEMDSKYLISFSYISEESLPDTFDDRCYYEEYVSEEIEYIISLIKKENN